MQPQSLHFIYVVGGPHMLDAEPFKNLGLESHKVIKLDAKLDEHSRDLCIQAC